MGRLFTQFTRQYSPNPDFPDHAKFGEFEILTDDDARDDIWVLQALCQDFLEYIKSKHYSYRDDYEGADNPKRDEAVEKGIKPSSEWNDRGPSGDADDWPGKDD